VAQISIGWMFFWMPFHECQSTEDPSYTLVCVLRVCM